MATKTVGPAHDYSTLQAWADAELINGFPEEAEVYGNIDVGGLTIDPITYPSEALVRAAPGNQHDGTTPVGSPSGIAYAAANFDISTLFFTIRGMLIYGTIQFIPMGSDTFVYTVEKCQFVTDGGVNGVNQIYMSVTDPGGAEPVVVAVIRNNVIYFSPTSDTFPLETKAGIYVQCGSFETGVPTLNATVVNNTVITTGTSLRLEHCFRNTNSGGSLTLTVRNNIGLSALTSCFTTPASGSVTWSHNLSTDATADDGGATGAQINKVAADTVVTPATDGRIKSGSAALNNGVTLGDFSDDIVGTARPQNAAWDIGAFEIFVAETGPTFGAGGGWRYFVEGGSGGGIIGG